MSNQYENVDFDNLDEVTDLVKRLVVDVWNETLAGLPKIVAVNVSGYLNQLVLKQLGSTQTLLNFLDFNSGLFEDALTEVANRAGEDLEEEIDKYNAAAEAQFQEQITREASAPVDKPKTVLH